MNKKKEAGSTIPQILYSHATNHLWYGSLWGITIISMDEG